jgi:ribonuclease BN (tRNA processing enzyme)
VARLRRGDEGECGMALEVTVLGSAGSHTGPGSACSGYLFRADGVQLLVDCGNGASANLQRFTRFEDLDAILITHRHVDHCIDLIGMYYGLRFHADGGKCCDLYAADEVVDTLTKLLSDDSALGFHEAFTVHDVRGGDRLEVGPMKVELAESIHPVPTVSVAVEVDGKRVVYSSDSAGGDGLIEIARGADLFLCEATWQGDADGYPEGLHLTARDAGRIATAAGVDRLVLTHILGSLDREVSRAEAAETFHGQLEVAEDLRSWVVA